MASRWPTARELMTPRPSTLPHDAPIAKALGLMRSKGFHEIPVLRKSRLIGMITFESIARRVSRSLDTKVEHILLLPPLITPATPLPEIAEQLLAAGLRAAPVVGPKGDLLGIVSRTDIVRSLVSAPEMARTRVEEISRSADLLVRESDECRQLIGQIRLLEEHPLPVLDRKDRLVGAVGVADLGGVLWRPVVGGKRDARTGRPALDVKVGSIMHSPAITVPRGTPASEAARLMTSEKVSSVFVVEPGKDPRVVGQSQLLQLVVGQSKGESRDFGVEDVYVEVTGLRGSGDPGLLADIDHLVAAGLRRVAQQVRPTLLSLHFAPHATHRTSDLTVEARLHTDSGIFYASHTGWNILAGVSDLLDELVAQTRRVGEGRRQHVRGRRALRDEVESDESTVDDPDLERRIRSATRRDAEDDEDA
ncbi:MAG TPA: CBS domain-containing protein [Thermoplasmata archaeon]|nr:CBS domain-containing protein [Thermoplasmata archaeon]